MLVLHPAAPERHSPGFSRTIGVMAVGTLRNVEHGAGNPAGAAPAVRGQGCEVLGWTAAATISLDDWRAAGYALVEGAVTSRWALGDWLRFGCANFGGRYREAAPMTGYDVQSLRNMVYVAARFPRGRRRSSLSWSHHAAVASFEAVLRDAWLDRAERETLSVRVLRQLISRGQTAPSDGAQRGDREAVRCPHCGRAIRVTVTHA
jgi:hypothetical protein